MEEESNENETWDASSEGGVVTQTTPYNISHRFQT